MRPVVVAAFSSCDPAAESLRPPMQRRQHASTSWYGWRHHCRQRARHRAGRHGHRKSNMRRAQSSRSSDICGVYYFRPFPERLTPHPEPFHFFTEGDAVLTTRDVPNQQSFGERAPEMPRLEEGGIPQLHARRQDNTRSHGVAASFQEAREVELEGHFGRARSRNRSERASAA